MRATWSWLGAAGIGAGLMYLFDPQMGRRRRALARDKAVRAWNTTACAIEATSKDVRNRTVGLTEEVRSRFRGNEPVDDPVLEGRIRARLGRALSHPRSIDVTVAGGRVTLAGPILTQEAGGLIAALQGIRGVTEVEDRLERHDEPGDVSGLQGGTVPPDRVVLRGWSPTARLLAGATGGALALFGVRRFVGRGALETPEA